MGNNMDNRGRREGEAKPVLPGMRPYENPGNGGASGGGASGGGSPVKKVVSDTQDKVREIIHPKK